jgi:hypothetical protein
MNKITKIAFGSRSEHLPKKPHRFPPQTGIKSFEGLVLSSTATCVF